MNWLEEAEEEAIRVANEMRKGSEALDPRQRDRLFFFYYGRVRAPQPSADFLALLPPDEHLATFRWLFDAVSLEEGRRLVAQYLGQPREALREFRSLQSKVAGAGPSPLREAAEAGIKRLSRRPIRGPE